MGNQTRRDLMAVKSSYTTHLVPMHSWRKLRGTEDWELSDGLGGVVGVQAPELSGPVNGHLSSGV